MAGPTEQGAEAPVEAVQETVQKVEIVETPELSIHDRLLNYFEADDSNAQQEDVVQEASGEAGQEDNAEDVQLEEESADHASDERDELPELEEGEEAEEAAEELYLDTLSDLAEHNGLDVAELYQLKVPMTNEDGTKTEISIGDWKDNVQSVIKQEREVLKTEAAERENASSQQRDYFDHQIQNATVLINALQQDLTEDINAVNWQQLRHDNPGEYAAKQAESEAKVKRLESYKQQVEQQMTQNQNVARQQYDADKKAHEEREYAILLDKIPAWNDKSKATAESAEIGAYLTTEGFTPENIGGMLSNHAFIIAARKAMLYDRMDKSTPIKKKIVNKAKRTVKPGSKQTKGQLATENTNKAKATVKEAGTVDALADYLKGRGM